MTGYRHGARQKDEKINNRFSAHKRSQLVDTEFDHLKNSRTSTEDSSEKK